ncbi:MAG: class I SAM-dependent DNA methyltransferase, partial [Terriglobia bacterium]
MKLLYPVSTDEDRAIGALARVECRLGSLNPEITRGYDEANAKKMGLIRWDTSGPDDWAEVILRGPQINIATPIAKQPPNTKHTDKPVDLTTLNTSAVPTTDYRRATDLSTYLDEQDRWFDSQKRYTEFYRVAWREMIPASTARSLFPAVIPPGPAHIHGVRSMALTSNRQTAMIAGFWAAIPLDYALRIGSHGHLDVADARMMPAPNADHPLSEALLLRTLRLNCLTNIYDSLWRELYRDAWKQEEWAASWPEMKPLSVISPQWECDTPLRAERDRRSALVELDVLAAIMLEMSADELIALYRSRFPQLVDYESEMWFDSSGRKLAANFNQWGHGQTKEHWE